MPLISYKSAEMHEDFAPRSEVTPYDLHGDWSPQLPVGMSPLGQSQDADYLGCSWYELGALSEAVLKMFPPTRSALERLLTYVIGDGFNINPNTGDQALDDDLEEFFLNVSTDAKEIDFDEESNLNGVLRKLLRGALVPGGHFAVFVNREETGSVGKVQLIEAYRCKTPYTASPDERVVHGVRLARNSRRQIGYYFEEDDIGWEQYIRSSVGTSKYLPAEDSQGNKAVVHFRLPDRASGTKSDGIFACSLKTTFQHLNVRTNIATKTEIANAISLIKEIDPAAKNFEQLAAKFNEALKDKSLTRGLGFVPGQSVLIPPGMRAKIDTPNIPNTEYFDLDDIWLRELGSLFWISKELLLLDASTSNYSSIRMLMRAAEPGFRYFQRLLAYDFLRHWWSFKLRDHMLTDRAIARVVERMKYDPHRAKWDFPGWKGLDPEKDFESDNDRMSNGHASDSTVFQERGLNYSKEAPRIASDAAWRAELIDRILDEPAMQDVVRKNGISRRELFLMLYGRTTPNGQKMVEALAKLKGNSDENLTADKSTETHETRV